MINVNEIIDSFETLYPEGFLASEIEILLDRYKHSISKEHFNEALTRCTVMLKDNQIVIYHIDIINALRSGLNAREVPFEDWD